VQWGKGDLPDGALVAQEHIVRRTDSFPDSESSRLSNPLGLGKGHVPVDQIRCSDERSAIRAELSGPGSVFAVVPILDLKHTTSDEFLRTEDWPSHPNLPNCSRTTRSNRADSSIASINSAVNRSILASNSSPSSSAAAVPTYRPGVSA